MWFLTSTRAKRIGDPKKMRPSGKKDYSTLSIWNGKLAEHADVELTGDVATAGTITPSRPTSGRCSRRPPEQIDRPVAALLALAFNLAVAH
jgi:hypothetical protein